MPRPQGARNGADVKRVEPRGLEEHDLGNVLHLPGDDDVSLERDGVACNRDVAELVPGGSGDLVVVVLKDELVDKLVGAELQCGADDEGGTRGGEPPVVLEIDEIIVQDVEPKAHGDAV
jgi:hypothetical protein